MSKKLKQTYFKVSYLDFDQFNSWLCKASTDLKRDANFVKFIYLSATLVLWQLKVIWTTKLIRNLSWVSSKKIKNFFDKQTKDNVEPTNKDVPSDTPDEFVVVVSTVSSAETRSTIPCSLLDDEKLTAEIWWAIKHVNCGYSDNSVTDSLNTFKVMFLDSKIASKMGLGKEKLKYLVNYGIAPFLAEGWKKEVSESE